VKKIPLPRPLKMNMKNIRICSVVTGSNLKEFLKNLDRVQEISEMVELRVDKIKDLREKDLMLIRKKTLKESILTGRNKEINSKALEIGFDYVDIDFSLLNNLGKLKTKRSRIIISFHDFNKTPTLNSLKKLKKKMKQFHPDVMKFATMVNSEADINILLKLLLSKDRNEKMIVVGMGEKGKIIRVVGPLIGSFLTYASTNYGRSEQGQIDILMLKKIYQLIN
jgi:3-dehydroquinate dehydratase I